MKKLFYFLMTVVMFMSACNKDFGDLNTDKKKPANVPPPTLFAAAQKEMVDLMVNSNVNRNIFRLLAQQWTETTYIDEANYDLSTRNIPQNFWNIMYAEVLKNLDECQKLIPDQDRTFVPANQQSNQDACCELLTVYTYSTLVNIFGDIPYSEAIDITNVHPKYDDARGIYTDLLARIDAAMAAIDVAQDGFGSSDLILGGDMAGWMRFGNSLKLRLGMMLADVDATAATTAVEAAAAGAVQSNADNIYMNYLSSPPNTNQIWVDLVESGRKDFVAANTLVDAMMLLGDPRIPFYFTTDANDAYSGGIYAASNNYSTYSKPGDRLIAPDFEATLFDASETHFLLAEAVERGMNVGGTAADHYEAGIRASMGYWKVSNADADAYMLKPEVAYATAAGDYKAKIGNQKWIALYNRGFEAWTEVRRLDNPVLVAPPDAESGFPMRYTYPVQEQNLNLDSYTAGATAVGGDVVETKLFWDIF